MAYERNDMKTYVDTYGLADHPTPKATEERTYCLCATHEGGADMWVSYGERNEQMNDETTYMVRRLTPTECERLQGYPDDWTNIGEWIDTKGKKHDTSDSNRYKALGNSICLPFWRWMIVRMCALSERPMTMGSLFDGIGGFPYWWERINGQYTARWASEIEEFPIAVTKLHFPEPKQKGKEEDKALGIGMQSSSGVGALMNDAMPTLTNGDNPGWQQGVCHSYKKDHHPKNSIEPQGWSETDVSHTLNNYEYGEMYTPTLNVVPKSYTAQDREGKAGGGKGLLIKEEASANLTSSNNQYLFAPTKESDNDG